jgi:hypothetical protein
MCLKLLMRGSHDIRLGWPPRLRRFGAWLAIFALTVHALAMAAHQPALSGPAPFPYDPHAFCHMGDAAPEDGVPSQSGGHDSKHAGAPCPMCQRLGALDSYLPVLVILLVGPSAEPIAISGDSTAARLPRLALTSLNPRGPPALA